MTEDQVLSIARQTIWLIIKCSIPLLLVSLVVGLIISIFQTVTSIQEQTLTFVPKLLTIFLMIMLIGNWMMKEMAGFLETVVRDFSIYIS